MVIFLDTNIMLNSFLTRDDDTSSQVIAFLLEKEYEIYINAISIINIDYHLKKEFSRHQRKKTIQFLLDYFHIVQSDKNVFQKALDSDFTDFEDSVQYFSSKNIEAELIITDDKKGFKNSEIPVFKAKDFFKRFIK
ncbi:MAG: hypothetical protein DSZ06_02490 [Sulfurospirillum sp.]|nr:MAG: hypothetical protein DSZ06_02490 [Sulfurospirillum sp.]